MTFMKRINILLVIMVLILGVTACTNRRDNCIERYIEEDGYTFDEAAEMCDEAMYDNY